MAAVMILAGGLLRDVQPLVVGGETVAAVEKRTRCASEKFTPMNRLPRRAVANC
jgi:hypothetical protein